LSELMKWFEKRRESEAMLSMQRHLALTMTAVEDLERAIKASVDLNEKETMAAIERVTSAEREADKLRRAVMTELAAGELPSTDREDLMHLMKRVDMVADWSRESTRVLSCISMKDVPENLKEAAVKMAEGVKECAKALRKAISRMSNKPEEALQAADEVERLEENVDDLLQKSRHLLGKELNLSVGPAILINELYEAIEMVADLCEDACDQIRVIIIRR
jgi:predicted phosphate transport protein (TIGR00153 family)